MFHRYITIEIRDRQTDALIFITKRAVVTSRVEDIKADSLATVTLTWRAIGWQDEIEPNYPDGVRVSDDTGIIDSIKTNTISRIA